MSDVEIRNAHLTIAVRMGLVGGILAAAVVAPLALRGLDAQALVAAGFLTFTLAAAGGIHLGRMVAVWLVGGLSVAAAGFALVWLSDAPTVLLLPALGIPFECFVELAPACRKLRPGSS